MTAPAATHTESIVEVAGGKVRVLQGGAGRPLVLLHHSTGNPGWMPLHERLARDFGVFAPDMPGYGQSDRPAWARDARDMAILCHRLVERLGLDGVVLAGLGFGGYVAAEMAAMNDSGLRGLVLVGAAGLQPENGEIFDQMMVDFDEYVQAGFSSKEKFHEALGDNPREEFKQLWDLSREMTARLAWKPYMFNRRLAPLLAEVRVPALIIWGGEDRVVPVACAHQYAAALPNAKVEVLAGAGHLVELEQTEKVASLIQAFAGSIR